MSKQEIYSIDTSNWPDKPPLSPDLKVKFYNPAIEADRIELARLQGIKSLEREVIEAAKAKVRYEHEADRLMSVVPHSRHTQGSADKSSEEWRRYVDYVQANSHVCKDFRGAVERLLEIEGEGK